MNCGACAIALDHTLGGAPASALKTDVMNLPDLARRVGRTWADWGNVRKSVHSITKDLEVAGWGARGVVYGGRGTPQNPGLGHFLNAVNQGGTVKYLDGQAGVRYRWTTSQRSSPGTPS